MNEMIKQGFAKKVADMITDPVVNGKIFCSVGKVLKYYSDNHTLDLTLTIQGTEAVRRSVPILINDPNYKTYYHEGDVVVVLFIFGDNDMPVAMGKLDEQFMLNSKSKLQSTLINLP